MRLRFVLFLILFCLATAWLGPGAGRGNADVPGAGGAAGADRDAEEALTTFNETIAVVVLLIGSIVTVYYLKTGNKMRGRRKAGGRRAHR